MKRYSKSTIFTIVLLVILASSADAQVGRGKFGFGVSASGNMLQSDWKTNDPGFGASADISYLMGENWGLLSTLGFDTFNGKNSANQTVLSTAFHGKIALTYDFLRDKPLNPFVFAGGSVVFYNPRVDKGQVLLSGANRPWEFCLNGGIGVDYFLNESWSVIVSGEAGYMIDDWLDGYGGPSNDIIQRVSVGVRYYLFDRSTVQRIVATSTR
jgi:hypothetical protein